MVRSFFEDVPGELEEAVRVDAGTWFTGFRMIATRSPAGAPVFTLRYMILGLTVGKGVRLVFVTDTRERSTR